MSKEILSFFREVSSLPRFGSNSSTSHRERKRDSWEYTSSGYEMLLVVAITFGAGRIGGYRKLRGIIGTRSAATLHTR